MPGCHQKRNKLSRLGSSIFSESSTHSYNVDGYTSFLLSISDIPIFANQFIEYTYPLPINSLDILINTICYMIGYCSILYPFIISVL